MAEKKQDGERGYLHRAYIRKSTRAEIEKITDKKQWEFKQDKRNYTKEFNGKVRNGQLMDANTGKRIRGKADIGHRSGYEERVMRECAERMHLSQKDYNNLMNNPKLYQFEDHRSNRSHKYEETNKKAQVSKAMREINKYQDAKKKGQNHAETNRMVHKNTAAKPVHTQSMHKHSAVSRSTSVHSGHTAARTSGGKSGHSGASPGGGKSGHSK